MRPRPRIGWPCGAASEGSEGAGDVRVAEIGDDRLAPFLQPSPPATAHTPHAQQTQRDWFGARRRLSATT